MKSLLAKSLRYIILIAVVALLGWYITTNWESFANISLEHPIWLIASAVFLLGNIFSLGMATELAIEPHGVKLKKQESFGLMGLTRFVNQFAPSYVSTAIRATYLKKKHGVSYTKFSSSFVVTNALQLLFSGIAILVTYLLITGSNFELGLIGFVIIFLGLFILLLYLPLTWLESLMEKLDLKTKNRIIHRLRAILTEYVKVRKHGSLFIRTLFWCVVTLIFTAGLIYAIFHAIGVYIDIPAAIIIASLLSWSLIFSITPAGIGVREGLIVVGAQMTNNSIESAIVASLLIRAVTIVVTGLLSLYYGPRLLKNKAKTGTK